jgi:hypothetical protein
MNELSFDQEQLAAVLERVQFDEDDVLAAIQLAQSQGSAEVGVFALQGQTQFSINPVIVLKGSAYALNVCVFNNDVELTEAGHLPEFTVALTTTGGDILTSRRETWDGGDPLEVIPLDNPARQLTGAHLELWS